MKVLKEEDFQIKYDPVTKIISLPEIPFNIDYKGLGQFFYHTMKKNKDKIAQYLNDTGEEDKYGSLLQRCVQTALHLKSRNLNEDDVIINCTHNHLNSCVPFVAAQFLGVKIASLDPSLSVGDVTHLLKQVNYKIIFADSSSIEMIEKSLIKAGRSVEIVVFEGNKHHCHTKFETFLEPHELEAAFKPVEVDVFQTCAIFFSSGTTGLAKGICLHHYAMMGQATNFIRQRNYPAVSVDLGYASEYWISCPMIFVITVMLGGARVVCSHYDPNEIWKTITKYKVTSVMVAPNQAIDMTKAGCPIDADTRSLYLFLVGGGHISSSYIKSLRELLPNTFVIQGYGQTELAILITCFKINELQRKPHFYAKLDSSGTIAHGIEYKVVNTDTDQACGPYETGELRLKTKFVLNGYCNMDSSSAFDSDGWLKTGDVVYFDDDFCFFVVDRIKEMLKYKSWHVAPAALEQVIIQHPAVRRVVVIGLPHEEDGDHPMAVIQLHENSNVTSHEIEKFVEDRVHSRQRLRGGVKFVSSIPETPSAKYKRREIRNLVLENKI